VKYTHLIIEGVSPDEITTDFLVAVEDASKDHDLDAQGISIQRED